MKPLELSVLGLLVGTICGFADTLTVEIQADIDGESQLILTGNTLQWHNLSFCAPGLHVTNCGDTNFPTVLTTTLNGNPELVTFDWFPNWPSGNYGDIYSSADAVLVPSIAPGVTSVFVTPITARGPVTLVQAPSPFNAWTTMVDINDAPIPTSALYDFSITFQYGPVSATPELSTIALVALGLTTLALRLKR